jgi:hypothetical protein
MQTTPITVLDEKGFLPGAFGAFIGFEPKFPKLIFVSSYMIK